MAWYHHHHRKLPWRTLSPTTPDPYHVLLSESMLQQTQVKTAVAYFNRFIKQLPTVQHLAEADEAVVLSLWQGLGYYRRARHLHAAAKNIVTRHGGRIPDRVELLSELPGVGIYTAGAIASIAYNRRCPAVDGNVARVLARWLAFNESIDDPKSKQILWSQAKTLLPNNGAGDFNQALMELGALVCRPKQPHCQTCPVANWCRAHRTQQVNLLPRRQPRRAPRPVTHQIVAIEKNGRFLFEKRSETGLWPHMWQLTTAEELRRPSANTVQTWIDQRCGLGVAKPVKVGDFVHQTTHRTIRFVLWRTSVNSGRLRRGHGAWCRLNRLEDLPMSNAQRRAVSKLAK